uniref:RNA-binding protein 14 n=1 Tax=Sinocyclocheilus rhinocerous TaxID=307959 RepID=A0A673IVG6_9TELE
MVKIFVGNVASATTEDELRALFEKYGAVSDCDILKNYGFVHMDEEEAAQKAVSALHKHEVNGSRITVEYATTKVRNATKIYVGNVPEGVTAAKIKELFQPFGKVVECDIVKNYAFVHMQRESEALEAISKLNHSKLEGQKVFVSLSLYPTGN